MHDVDMFPDTITDHLPAAIIKQVAGLDAEQRADLFFLYVNKTLKLWALKGNDGFVMVESDNGTALPLWPHQDLVSSWQPPHGHFPDAEPAAIELNDFTDTWLPGLDKNDISLIVFPLNEDDAGILLTAQDMATSLSEENSSR